MRRPVSVTAIVVLFSMLLMSSVPTVNSGSWAVGPTMSTARTNAAATLLQDGRVLITGGTDANGATLGSVEIFGADGTFGGAAPMLEARSGHAAVVLKDGTVLVTGGTTSAGPTNSAEIYNASNNTWTAVGAMTEARSGHTATLLTDGRVALIGGANSTGPSATIDIFDPASKSFTSAGNLAVARKGHAAAALANGTILIAGGFGVKADGSSVALNSSEIFDPATGAVSSAAPLAVARGGHSATALLDGSVVVIGGNNGTSELTSAEVYQPATGTWSTVSGSALQTARSGHSAFLLPNNNSVLIVGGDSAGVDQASAELFIPWSGHFQNTGALSAARAGASGAALSTDGLLLLAGGSNLASSEIYGFATLKTDKSDYAPGQPVTITGSGWQPGEVVRLVLQESPDFDEHPAMTATADAFGNIVNTQFAPDQHDLGIRFYLTAYGTQSQAQNTFTDAGSAAKFIITGSATQTAGTANTITITALDSTNAIATGYTGSHNLTFSGATSIGSFNPTTDGTAFGTAIAYNFSGGSAVAHMTLYRAASNNIAVTDGTISTTNPLRLAVTVSAAALDQFELDLDSPQTVGTTFTGTDRIFALDHYGNTVTTFDASTDNVTFTTTLSGSVKGLDSPGNVLNQAGEFNSGVCNLKAQGIKYVGTIGTGTFTATSSTGKFGTSGSVTINPGTATDLKITGASTQTAGNANNLTITALDTAGNTATGYTGDESLTFGGPSSIGTFNPTVTDKTGAAVNFGTATTITFTNGVATVTGSSNGAMTLYKSEVVNITTTDGTISATGSKRLHVTVAPANAASLNIGAPAFPNPTVAGTSGNLRVTAKDQYGNLALGYTGTVHFVSNDLAAVLPADYTYTLGDLATHVFSATLNTGGLKAIKVTDTSNPSLTDTQTNILVETGPMFTSANHTTFTVGSTGSFTVMTTGTPLLTLTKMGNLPSGVTFVDHGDGTATLGGNPAVGTGGVYTFTITATNIVTSAMQSFTLTVNEAPAVTSAASTTFVAGQYTTFTVTTRGYPIPSISKSGMLPSGVTFMDNHDGTATISGTPAVGTGGIYPIVIGVTNGIGMPTIQSFSFTLTVNEATAILSAASTTFKVGVPGTFTVTTRGFPKPTLAEMGSLPMGVGFVDNLNGTATLSGTPMVAGTFHLVITAHNGVGPDSTQNFTLIVNKGDSTSKVTGPSGNFFSNGQLVTLTATVTGKGVTPTGMVTFHTSTTQGYILGSVAVGANGVATLKVVLPPGNNYIHTEYAGDSNYLSSNSPYLLLWMYQ